MIKINSCALTRMTLIYKETFFNVKLNAILDFIVPPFKKVE